MHDIQILKPEIMKSLTTSDKHGRLYLSSEVLFRTKESLIDFCETDDIYVAVLTKVAFYMLDRFSAQITQKVMHGV